MQEMHRFRGGAAIGGNQNRGEQALSGGAEYVRGYGFFGRSEYQILL